MQRPSIVVIMDRFVTANQINSLFQYIKELETKVNDAAACACPSCGAVPGD